MNPGALRPWDPSAEVLGPLSGGHRSAVWAVRIGGRRAVARRNGRTVPALKWELDLLADLAGLGFCVPRVVRTRAGARREGHVVVMTWVDGTHPPRRTNGAESPPSFVACTTQLEVTRSAPGSAAPASWSTRSPAATSTCGACQQASWAAADRPGGVWAATEVSSTAIPGHLARAAADAWEAATCWQREPACARRRLASLDARDGRGT